MKTFHHKISPLFFTVVSLIFIFGSIILLPLAFGFARTGKHTSVLGQDYSLLKKSQIIDRLRQDFPLPSNITLTVDSRQFALGLASISAQIDFQQMASDLLFRRLKKGLLNYFFAFFHPKDFTLDIIYDQVALDGYLATLSASVDTPFVPSELYLDSQTVSVKEGQLGQVINIDNLKNLIHDSLKNYSFSPISIPLTTIGALPDETSIYATIATAKNLIGHSLEFTTPDKNVIIDDKTLVSWLDFNSSCRRDQVREYVTGLTTSLKKDPIDAVFKFENGKVTEFRSSEDGYQLDDSNLDVIICNKIAELTSSDQSTITSEFPTSILTPKITNSQANDLGIKELLGTGKSTFKHSSATRNFNVEKGASIVNRILVAPGQTFSFLENLGEVSLASGFKQAYVINKGKTELDVGGGICQVSTTLFRAMLNAGVDITYRQAHAYRVGYYEEDSPPGFDATVFIPDPDLKFINDTGHHLLIQSTYDGVNKTLVYDIYGTSDGRQVDISNYRRWDATPPPPDIYIDDPTLPVGKVIQDEHAVAGLKTAFDWKVTRDGQIIHQKTYQSSYVPWAAVYRRGPTQ